MPVPSYGASGRPTPTRSSTRRGRLETALQLAVELLEGCDHAGLLPTSPTTASLATDDIARSADGRQRELADGPAFEALRTRRAVVSHDLTAESRWRAWTGSVVRQLGVRAVLCLPLAGEDDVVGTLDLYADGAGGWSAGALTSAPMLADQVSAALIDAREIETRGQAMAGRTVVGQAQGILMERLGLDADRAFGYLRRISQADNRKLVDVAAELVRSRRLPGGGADPVSGA